MRPILKHFPVLLFSVFLVACGNKDSSKETTITDSTSITTDSIFSPVTETPNLDSLARTPAIAASVEPIQVKFNLPQGKSYAYSADLEMNRGGEGQVMQSNMSYNYILSVTGSKKNSRLLKATYGDMRMEMDMNGRKMSFGTAEKSSEAINPLNMINNMFAAMKGKSFIMEINDQGEIISVEGINEMSEAIMNELKIPESSRESFNKSFQSQFNENSIRQIFSESFNIYPSRKIKPGDTWEKKAGLAMGDQKIETTTVYTLKEIRGNQLVIDAATRYQHSGNKNMVGNSRLIVDARTGLVIKSDGEQKLEGTNNIVSRNHIRSREL